MTLPMHTSKRCSIKSTEDQGKNSTLTRLNVVSSETSTNFAFAVGLYRDPITHINLLFLHFSLAEPGKRRIFVKNL